MASDTKESILDAAEKLFAERGFGATSLRTITAAAKVNLAAVNYHFGSKDALIEAVLARRVCPMNAERVARLDRARADFGAHAIPLERLIEAFVGPPMELSRDRERGGARFIQLLGRTYTEPTSSLHDVVRAMHTPVIDRFKGAFAEVLPELPGDELYWRLHFMVGLMAYLMAGSDLMRLIASCRVSDPTDTDALIERMVGFVKAGMEAPLPATIPASVVDAHREHQLGGGALG
jgi:AcrR family transcriptional regulator